jgi:transcriptional regulator GlxA family with amidase domain
MSAESHVRNVAILVFDDVEVLDFCGPFEVFSVTGRNDDPPPFHVYTVAEKSGTITARNGLRVIPHFTLAECPPPSLLVVPGGQGTRREMHNAALLAWVAARAAATELTLSVCTGALILAKAELLDGLEATTHHGAIDLLRETAPRTTVDPRRRVVDNGHIILSAGVAAGIDMSLYVVAKLLGQEKAEETARYIEYPWPRPGWETTG